MLVRAKNDSDIRDYGPIGRLKKDHLYVVYAIERGRGNHNQDSYAVIPFNPGQSYLSDGEIDPHYLDSGLFTVEIDLVSKEWITKTVPVTHGNVTISSFKEWFEEGFYYRAHDWDLKGKDYDIMKKYFDKYEEIYREYIDTKEIPRGIRE